MKFDSAFFIDLINKNKKKKNAKNIINLIIKIFLLINEKISDNFILKLSNNLYIFDKEKNILFSLSWSSEDSSLGFELIRFFIQ
jgi:hypothetical protein